MLSAGIIANKTLENGSRRGGNRYDYLYCGRVESSMKSIERDRAISRVTPSPDPTELAPRARAKEEAKASIFVVTRIVGEPEIPSRRDSIASSRV